MASSTSISNMNIITLIKEIFQTLKNLDARYYTLEDAVKSSMGNIETKIALLQDKISEITRLQMQLLEMNGQQLFLKQIIHLCSAPEVLV